jgi:hypothetical protein
LVFEADKNQPSDGTGCHLRCFVTVKPARQRAADTDKNPNRNRMMARNIRLPIEGRPLTVQSCFV